MSIKVANISLTSATVGQQLAAISWAQFVPGRSQAVMDDSPGAYGYLRLINESGCGLDLDFNGGSGSRFAKAGGEPLFELRGDDTSVMATVNYVIPGQQVSTLVALYYRPGEPVDVSGTIGNSPIGGTVTPMSSSDIDSVLVSPGVVAGINASVDPSILNQLDVTSGTAFLQTAAGLMEVVNTVATHFLTSQANATYFLDLNTDGSFSWSLTHSADPHALQLWTVTTNVSGNIASTASSANFGTIALLSAVTGTLQIGSNAAFVDLNNNNGGTALGFVLEVGSQPTVGFLGVPPIVAQVYEQHVTGTGTVTLITFTPSANGLYRVSGFARVNNGTNGNNCKLQVTFFDPQKAGGTSDFSYMVGINGASGAGVQFGGASSVSNNPYAFEPQVFDCTAGKALTIAYTDPTNTPSDFVSIIVERLS